MKWFIKVLSQYADFSGRARRKEYWMFVLFNSIVFIAWVFLTALILLFTTKGYDSSVIGIQTVIIYLSYYLVLTLPSLAVAVRRLHDVGKSGWMLLISLIPIVGGIWLFVLMVTEGEELGNEYGTNPKRSFTTFDEQARLKSAGITMTVAYAIAFIITIISTLLLPILFQKAYFVSNPYMMIQNILQLVATVLLFILGIYLLNERTINELLEEKKFLIILLLIAVSIYLVLSVFGLVTTITYRQAYKGLYAINSIVYLLLYLSIALFAVSLLSTYRNKKFIRTMAVISIVFSGLCLLWKVFFSISIISQEELSSMNIPQGLLEFFYILMPVAFIVLAATFLSGIEDKIIPQQSFGKDNNYYKHASYTISPPPGNANKAVYLREDRDSGKVWRIYTAPSKADATAFLSRQQVNRSFFYIVVETPEGNFGKDIDGVYQE